MSDRPQGEGWWLASDGKWYPPESHPSAQQPAAPPSAVEPLGPAPPLPQTPGSPPGDGWWMASDGNWYPPNERPGPAAPPTPGAFADTVTHAGFWRRFVAVFIDSILLGIVLSSLAAVLSLGTGARNLLSLFGLWLYFALLESSAQQATLGKRAMEIIVTDINGNRISFGRATGRHFSKIISALILFVGFFMAGITKYKQALHDQMTDCLVVVR